MTATPKEKRSYFSAHFSSVTSRRWFFSLEIRVWWPCDCTKFNLNALEGARPSVRSRAIFTQARSSHHFRFSFWGGKSCQEYQRRFLGLWYPPMITQIWLDRLEKGGSIQHEPRGRKTLSTSKSWRSVKIPGWDTLSADEWGRKREIFDRSSAFHRVFCWDFSGF